ncbi:MAG: hypothetical protein MIO93_10010 [ANME-2 cluster archaeon]|nr:hypothetical protein [ANME-2 cluster archaeon]
MKLQAIDWYQRAASMILRIDDMIAASGQNAGPKQVPGLKDYEVEV